MIVTRRLELAAALLAILAAAAVTLAVVRPAPLFPTASAADEMLPLGMQFSRAASFMEFLDAEPADRGRWLEHFDGSAAAVSEVLPRVREIPGRWHLLVVAETWCSDAYNSVPHLARLADESPNLSLRVVRKERAAGLLDAYQVDGKGRIPLVVLLDENLAERGVWIERPAALRAHVAKLREDASADVGAGVRAWYAEDGGRSALAEIAELIDEAARGGVVANPQLDSALPQCGGG
jgi:hypothetical protein